MTATNDHEEHARAQWLRILHEVQSRGETMTAEEFDALRAEAMVWLMQSGAETDADDDALTLQ